VLGRGGRCPWLMLVWAAMADLSVFSVLVSSFQSILVLAGCYRRPFFVKEYAVDQWTMWRTSHLLHHFLLSLVLPQTIFSWRYFPYLLVNEESQPFIIIMKLWEADFCLENVPLQRLELRAKRGGKNEASHGEPFSPLFFELF
jgi:hypothetical protein